MTKSTFDRLVTIMAWVMVIVGAWALAKGYVPLADAYIVDVEWWMAVESALAIASFLVMLFLTLGVLIEVPASEMSKKEIFGYVMCVFAVLVPIPLNMLRPYSEILHTVRFLPIDLVILVTSGSVIYEVGKQFFENWVLNRADQIRAGSRGKNNPA